MYVYADGPRITCTTRVAGLSDTNVNLKCEIDANPRVIALFWVLDQNGTTLAEGEVVDEAWTLVMVSTEPLAYYPWGGRSCSPRSTAQMLTK